ncbi:phage head spike fiber domain-containing protein [Martelella alba]|uniref:Uncharacterized protein n=1 Tax=Martelella alba TaxID=2590451 RepID=A0ABY2SSC9_9HYPH|nr:hypothetical protein [Martelella alba]TKI08330.1 hypothetical protein FCN80_04085 [Martelella alba]
MATVIKSNKSYIGDTSLLPSVNAPLPDGASLYADFKKGRFILKNLAGAITRATDVTNILSFSRSTTATQINAEGLLEYVAANVPAIDYHPITHDCLGFRSEYSATNQILWSQDFTQTESWTPANIELTSNNEISPDGNTTATKIIEATDSSAAVRTLLAITQGNAVVSNPYTFSIFAKAGTAKIIQLAAQGAVDVTAFANFDLENGVIGKISAGSSTVGLLQTTIEPFINGWYRCSITITPSTAVSPQFTVALVNNDASATALPSYLPTTPTYLYIWGAQPERGDGCSSYVPATGVSASRNSDQLVTNPSSDFVNASSGTIFISVTFPHSLQLITGKYGSLASACVISQGATTQYPAIRFSYRPPSTTGAEGAALGDIPDTSGTAQNLEVPSLLEVRDSTQSAIFSFDGSSLEMKVFDGYNWYSMAVTALPTALSTLLIGKGTYTSTQYLNGYVNKFVYWPVSLIESDMENAMSYL